MERQVWKKMDGQWRKLEVGERCYDPYRDETKVWNGHSWCVVPRDDWADAIKFAVDAWKRMEDRKWEGSMSMYSHVPGTLPEVVSAEEFEAKTGVSAARALATVKSISSDTRVTWARLVGCDNDRAALLSILEKFVGPQDVWHSARGPIPIKDLDDDHLRNILNMLSRHYEKDYAEIVQRCPNLRNVYLETRRRRILAGISVIPALDRAQHLAELLERKVAAQMQTKDRDRKEITMKEKLFDTTKDLAGCVKHGAAMAPVGIANRKAVDKIVERFGDRFPELRTPAGAAFLEFMIPATVLVATDLMPDTMPIPKRDLIKDVARLGVQDASRSGTVVLLTAIWDLLLPVFESYASVGATLAEAAKSNEIPEASPGPLDLGAAREKTKVRSGEDRS